MTISPSPHKSKLPKHLSYPIGFQALAAELAVSPHDLVVTFYVGCSTVREDKARRSGEYYPMLAAWFNHWRPGICGCDELMNRGDYDPKWGCDVYAVSRPLKCLAGELLRNEGLPQVLSWLSQSRSETWLQGTRRITVLFSDRDQRVTVQESAHA